ncbi:MAG TPA: metalloregulator ArsR/SmtB family transcription factor [Rhizomicrobium sp.]|jgi:ArsR family transcriptional regulator|nr:metalloregulator ArsR/SmtB family transcription factor [Rhizomicrobium sp.]
MNELLTMLRAAGDPTRLRLILLLREAELTVSELTQILGQSQPRVSRHLKLLCEAGLLQRFKEGSWVFYRAANRGECAQFADVLAALVDREPAAFAGDRTRLDGVRQARQAAATEFFKANAADWERIRSLHAPDQEVEAAILARVETLPHAAVLDAGTGTGRMLELLATHVRRGTGIDNSPEMLAVARDRLERIHAQHCQVRLGDIHRLPFAAGVADQGFDLAIFHQVLHYLEDPQSAVMEAARVLNPRGSVLIIDFAPHDLEFCRSELAHRRLGFSDEEVRSWFEAAGLKPSASQSITADGTEKLTVKLWLGAMAALPLAKRAREAA